MKLSKNNNVVRLSGIAYESLVNGPGLRRVFFAQGCAHNCDGCFNPSTHDFNGGELRNIDDLIQDVKINPLIKGITFSGGDPFYQAEAFAYMAEEIKKLKLNIWCYTGYKIEDILNNSLGDSGMHLLANLDVTLFLNDLTLFLNDFFFTGSVDSSPNSNILLIGL